MTLKLYLREKKKKLNQITQLIFFRFQWNVVDGFQLIFLAFLSFLNYFSVVLFFLFLFLFMNSSDYYFLALIHTTESFTYNNLVLEFNISRNARR